MILLENKKPNKYVPDVYLVNKGNSAEIQALSIARALRLEDLRVELDSTSSAFAKQFKRANRSKALHVERNVLQ